MKYVLLGSFFLSFNVFSGTTVFNDELDEFTDERGIFIGLIGDEHNSYLSQLIGIYCDAGKLRMGINKGPIVDNDPTLAVTLRFDKNKPINHEFYHNSEYLVSRNIDFIKLFIKELRNSNNLIVRIEGDGKIMRFTDLKDSGKHVAEFMNAASEMPPSQCNIFQR